MPRGLIMLAIILGAVALAGWWLTKTRAGSGYVRMPGKSFEGTPPPLTKEEQALRDELRADVEMLAGEIGERNVEHYAQLTAAADFIARSFTQTGLTPRRDGYEVAGKLCENIDVELAGASPDILVIGAHYDSVFGSPGANDNGSGVAAMLALARRFADKASPPPRQTLRFAAFANEEPGRFQTHEMGSWVYANRCQARGDKIVGMISLETVGYFSNQPGSQKFPMIGLKFFYPDAGNFIAFVSDLSSRALLRKTLAGFRRHATLPSEGAALPANVPGVGWSDHWAFWQHGYPAIMITDTAPFRYPHYHARSDTPEKLDYDAMARLVSALEKTLRE